MRMNRWEDIEASVGLLKIPIKLNKYMEVYDDLESLLKDYPKEQYYIQIEEMKHEVKN